MKGNLFEFIVAIIAIFLFPSLYTGTSTNNPQDVSSGVSYQSISKSGNSGSNTSQKFKNSVTLDNLCYMTIEASDKGFIRDVITEYYELENNKAPGWKHLKEGHSTSGYTWALWQSKYESGTYNLVFSGTDELWDVATYIPMMINEDYCTQMDEAINTAKKIKNYAPTNITKLYITGHSLGGYLAAYVTSDLVDSSLSSSSKSRISVNDISNFLTLDNVKGVTFGAPGFYVGNMKWTVIKKVQQITTWGQEKKTNNQNKKYDNYIENYTNEYDPVGHLFVGAQYFKHLGKRKDYEVERINAGFFAKAYSILSKFGELNKIADVYYHLPHVYDALIEGYTLVKSDTQK